MNPPPNPHPPTHKLWTLPNTIGKSMIINIFEEFLWQHASQEYKNSAIVRNDKKLSFNFQSKIAKIRCDISEIASNSTSATEVCESCPSALSQFQLVSFNYVKSVIMSSKAKPCQLDPVPTWILKGCIDALLPTITTIINSSLEQGRFPSKLKESVVRPSIKKPISDSEDNNNFRPISNLTFLSKTLERLVASQLDAYLTDHQLYANMQSAYRKHHSTETALLLGASRSISSLWHHWSQNSHQ